MDETEVLTFQRMSVLILDLHPTYNWLATYSGTAGSKMSICTVNYPPECLEIAIPVAEETATP